jgi:hypothetical protein
MLKLRSIGSGVQQQGLERMPGQDEPSAETHKRA